MLYFPLFLRRMILTYLTHATCQAVTTTCPPVTTLTTLWRTTATPCHRATLCCRPRRQARPCHPPPQLPSTATTRLSPQVPYNSIQETEKESPTSTFVIRKINPLVKYDIWMIPKNNPKLVNKRTSFKSFNLFCR